MEDTCQVENLKGNKKPHHTLFSHSPFHPSSSFKKPSFLLFQNTNSGVEKFASSSSNFNLFVVTNSCLKQPTPEFSPKNCKKAKTHRKIDYERRGRKGKKEKRKKFSCLGFKVQIQPPQSHPTSCNVNTLAANSYYSCWMPEVKTRVKTVDPTNYLAKSKTPKIPHYLSWWQSFRGWQFSHYILFRWDSNLSTKSLGFLCF